MTNDIGNIIFDTFKSVTGKSTTRAEINSWAKSLEYMERVTNDPAIPDDSGVAMNLLVALSKLELVAQYVTRNSAPRLVYEAKLTVLFVDEGHKMTLKKA